MLRHALDGLRMLAEQLPVTLFRRVPDPGDEQLLIGEQSLLHVVVVEVPDVREQRHFPPKLLYRNAVYNHRFNRLNIVPAGSIVQQALKRGDELAFGYELKGNLLPVTLKPRAGNSRLDIIYFPGNLLFCDQKRFGWMLLAFEKLFDPRNDGVLALNNVKISDLCNRSYASTPLPVVPDRTGQAAVSAFRKHAFPKKSRPNQRPAGFVPGRAAKLGLSLALALPLAIVFKNRRN